MKIIDNFTEVDNYVIFELIERYQNILKKVIFTL